MLRHCENLSHHPLGSASSRAWSSLPVVSNRTAQSKPSRRRCLVVQRACSDEEGEDEQLQVVGDWRAFRARLIAQEPASTSGQRISESNQRLLEMQNSSLAAEGCWCHPVAQIERGGILLSTPDTPSILGDDMLEQVAIFIMQHGPDGSVGVILNRPSSSVMGRKQGGLRFELHGAPPNLQDIFSDSRVYCGGKTAQQIVHILHGHQLPGSACIAPGIYIGGDHAAVKQVSTGKLPADSFRFFSGACVWEPGQLEREVAAGCWFPAACSRSLILKQAIQLPTPLWREMMLLMGGRHANIADQVYEGDEVSGE